MRLSAVPLVLAGASLAIQAGAVPLRVVVVSSHQEVSANNAHANSEANIVAAMPGPALVSGGGMMRVYHNSSVQPGERIRAHHCGGSVRDTMKSFINKVFGFSGGEQPHPHIPPPHEPGRVAILPWFGTPNDFADHPDGKAPGMASEVESDGRGHHHSHPPMGVALPHSEGNMAAKHSPEDVGPVRIVHISEQEGPRRRFRHRHGPFLRRMHFALMALGPWEGRAVAFVLGCGIGVLLRMVWVIGVVLARAVSGRRSEDSSEDVFDADAEEILVAPPQYTQYPDEKVAVVAAIEEKPQAA
ncbi:uncharacterized protein C8Q71DRAFT_491605 [Rhodofomes roseus]|uniref:Uncharacterized protein n=1 Tax=Rhodofomes roseus TaxID=34475 RepID=A0A4Y9YH32_9APHY|nr:uncharacterized protein C8Q71DRAFT_491605 [Rhodofomes roseus]KAH9839046.1 hypothetical protein C8Q71DRAFT_491605 [Rhodofomes roseus]TFY61884.1 hypothetical protein EVJ58_g4231 [Rhodofomes roseus]